MSEHRNLVITGSSKGIGLALARKLISSSQNRVLGIARSGSGMSPQEVSGNPGKYIHLQWDLADSSSIADLAERIGSLLPTVDILVNNAGLLINKPFTAISPEELDAMYAMHLKAPFLLIQKLLPLMRPGSHVVNISSMGGFQGSVKFPSLTGYSATKGSLAILTEALAVELSELGIGINCLAIGAVQTEMLSSAFPGYKAPLTAEEFARFASDFCINGHRYFQGKVLPVSLATP